MQALMTKVKSPRVIRFIGSEMRSKIGLIKVFKTPKTIATKTPVKKLLISIPGKMYPVASTAIVLTRREIKICITVD